MKNTLLDNTENRMMADALRECIDNPVYTDIMIATGFWDLPGTRLVAEELERFLSREGTTVRLLIGTDPVVRRQYLDKRFPDDAIKDDIFNLQFSEEYQPLIDLLFKYCKANPDDSKLKIRIYKRDTDGNAQFLHAKCYIFTDKIENAIGIIGSSNFTKKGLQGNSELNYVETDFRTIEYTPAPKSNLLGHTHWFDTMWEQGEDWNGEFINEILSKAPVGIDNPNNPVNLPTAPDALTPYEVYIKYLQLQFGDMVDANTTAVLQSYLPQTFNSLEYQLDAVKQCFSIMKRFGGFILGDVVGLGKTVVGVLLIRHFLENAESLGRAPKVLIVTPPAIKKAWEKTISDFDKENPRNNIGLHVEFVTTGSIGKIADDFEDSIEADDFGDGDEIDKITPGNYGMILIDESHNFRNSGTQKYQAVDDLIGLINPTPYLALLSATPQNNSPKDLYNQIRLFQRVSNNSNLPNVEGGKLDSFFNKMENRFKEARAIPQDTEEGKAEARRIIKEVSDQIRTCVLNDLVVRRTRTDIRNRYGKDARLLKFPTIKGPHKLEYKMDDELAQLFADTTTAICPPAPGEPFDPARHIGFYRYAAITQFVDNKNKQLYEKRNLTVESITRRLKRIMQILLVKRLESSLAAFKKTLENLNRYNNVMIDMLQNDCVFICPDIDVNKLHKESKGDFEMFRTAVEAEIKRKRGNNRRFRTSDFNESYLSDLKNDRVLIEDLLGRWRENTEDPKFERFREAINPELFNPEINNPSGSNKPRLVIFTEAIDTLKSLERALKAKGHKVLSITAKDRTDKQEAIEANFDANCKPERRRDDYDVIVTTEVLAEGVNLHRSNVILNYDAPWNATRLMQRIGRVNRIGSTEEFVHVFNFFPSTQGNSQIRLIEKAYAKLQSFHELFGEDNKVFSEREELVEHSLQDFVDGEESPFGPFINELKEYRETHPERYEDIRSIEADGLGGRIISRGPDLSDQSD
ncbi:MAG: DEAD/DEAH box helicase family protein, partial [Muribaculaceae bacterium]|nr:DEAD/DEAH box helicase family protein [Muribaculaceae bacterium]